MATVTIKLDNTNISEESAQYNLKAIIDLSDIYIPSNESDSYRLFIQTSITIPISKKNQSTDITISLFGHYNISDIQNNTIIQYGYYEGVYDDNRKIISSSNIFIYKISSIIQEE